MYNSKRRLAQNNLKSEGDRSPTRSPFPLRNSWLFPLPDSACGSGAVLEGSLFLDSKAKAIAQPNRDRPFPLEKITTSYLF
ncbi:hypothetical protein [Nostoc sp. UHCC 0251]|uniref:hypothetical protein n=1 Tax=Nostoc sp. UHCC 0251 TaxID=3110240 RepID=UPI002B20692B|nr:hypothetical protein [Nostoc sp. UHCC 0251]MEA5622781.1 hypothetical protein [Nostoc sp. UHCC 0251]